LDNLIDEDYRYLKDDSDSYDWIFDYDTGYLSVGGVSDYCIDYFTSWKGPVYDKEEDRLGNVSKASGLYTGSSCVPSKAYESICHVQNVYQIPASIKNINSIKALIMEHGSVTASICADTKYFSYNDVALYDYEPFEPDKNNADHEILIVGWSDDYAVDNFINAPPDKGAWICRNSWGKTSGENGYFYASFYDNVLQTYNVTAYSAALKEDELWFDNNYQVAGNISHITDAIVDSKNKVYSYDECIYPYGVIFEATGTEELKAVSFISAETDREVEISVYKNIEVKDNISFEEMGEPLQIINTRFVTGGFHTVELDKAIELSAGDNFFVVITPVNPGKIIYEKAMDSTADDNYDYWGNYLGSIRTVNTASGRSYFLSEDGFGLTKQEDKDFAIKAYTNDK
ncbi:MAG: hypothetical protein K6A23_06965, partial [Butyrivibrio sp.]|nr:hypothetical protein [Butyrivibrio sp.]